MWSLVVLELVLLAAVSASLDLLNGSGLVCPSKDDFGDTKSGGAGRLIATLAIGLRMKSY